MYIRDAKKREEVWLLDRLEEFGFEDPAFRSRDYVLAIDEESGTKVGFGRFRIHSLESGQYAELTCIGVRPKWRDRGVGAHIIERLLEHVRDEGCNRAVSFAPAPDYCRQFGFEALEPEALPEKLRERLATLREAHSDGRPMQIDIVAFEMPPRLRRRFEENADSPDETTERPEDFGIDPHAATYKYDTGGGKNREE
jgi:N-acetylglutamate synthase-like GNAT family acetyltransferase